MGSWRRSALSNVPFSPADLVWGPAGAGVATPAPAHIPARTLPPTALPTQVSLAALPSAAAELAWPQCGRKSTLAPGRDTRRFITMTKALAFLG